LPNYKAPHPRRQQYSPGQYCENLTSHSVRQTNQPRELHSLVDEFTGYLTYGNVELQRFRLGFFWCLSPSVLKCCRMYKCKVQLCYKIQIARLFKMRDKLENSESYFPLDNPDFFHTSTVYLDIIKVLFVHQLMH